MGGPCWIIKPVPGENRMGKFHGPACTDNFQICQFVYKDEHYHSAEQAFQARKFQPTSAAARSLRHAAPRDGESSHDYGMRVWQLGQVRDPDFRPEWDSVSMEEMYLINVAKFAQNVSMQRELIDETSDYELRGAYSTAEWEKWNGLIMLLIRQKIAQGVDLSRETAATALEMESVAMSPLEDL